jgi:hypothetical protein
MFFLFFFSIFWYSQSDNQPQERFCQILPITRYEKKKKKKKKPNMNIPHLWERTYYTRLAWFLFLFLFFSKSGNFKPFKQRIIGQNLFHFILKHKNYENLPPKKWLLTTHGYVRGPVSGVTSGWRRKIWMERKWMMEIWSQRKWWSS